MDKETTPYPWPAIITTLVVAVAVYGLGLIYSIERIGEARRQSVALQQAHAQQTALRLDGYFGLAAQLTDVTAATLGTQPGPYAIDQTLRQVISASGSRVQAIGAYYSQGYPPPIRVVRTPSAAPLSYDYVRRPWFKEALADPGKAVFSRADPPSGTPFVAVSESLGSKNPIGVAMIETSRAKLDSLLARSNGPLDRAWITDSTGNVIAGATPPPSMTIDAALSVPLAAAPWTLEIASHFADVDKAQRNALAIDLPLTIIAWGGALLTIFALLRVRKLQQRQAALQKSAMRDALTGLYNRAHVLWRLKEALRSFSLSKNPFGVLYIDLDRFAVVNDSLGHSVGDELLCAIAKRLEEGLPQGVEIGRIGGDEFVAYLPPGADIDKCESVADLIFSHVRQPFRVGDRDIYISASIGIVVAAPRYGKADELLRDADIAMYAAKRAGRNRLAIFDESMREQTLARHTMETALHRAIASSQIFARYQPIVNLATGEISGVEALARWMDERGTLIPPDLFIPLAEQCGAIDAIDWVVLARACSDVRGMQRFSPGLTVSVNLSAARLNQTDLVKRIRKVLEQGDLEPSSLKFEVTESAIMESPEDSLQILNELCTFGSHVVIDDFGTGHSSLSYVQRLPVAGLKIDRSFITPIVKDRQSLAIVQAIVALAKTLGIYVVAEGVEEAAQAERLADAGVDFGQGFYFAPALEIRAFQTFAESRKAAILSDSA
ncbi:MAG TPA: EAL domain-containing protein [Candidatus Baltobacteraceae bacterium]|nr:EAL domain-containing protein [Candidatus Baltobacteraceae bacterium]